MILDDKGDVYTWGYGGNGRLGHGDETSRVAPSRVHDIPPHEIAAVAAGGAFTVARSKSGLAIAWGAGHCTGQGEFGSHDDVLIPEIIPKTKTMDVTAVAAGGLHAALLTRDGGCYTWGWGECGQLGLGRRVAEVVRDPTQVDTESQRITMVACGAYHTAIVEEGGELMTFGAGGMMGTRRPRTTIFGGRLAPPPVAQGRSRARRLVPLSPAHKTDRDQKDRRGPGQRLRRVPAPEDLRAFPRREMTILGISAISRDSPRQSGRHSTWNSPRRR